MTPPRPRSLTQEEEGRKGLMAAFVSSSYDDETSSEEERREEREWRCHSRQARKEKSALGDDADMAARERRRERDE